MLKLCLSVILLGCVAQINCENLPVFIWGSNTPSFLPALNQLNGDEFVTLVKSQSDKETLTVVFVEKSLSVEDLSQCKLKTATCFENLRKVEQKTYLTAVEDPVAALETSFGKQISKTIWLSNEGKLSDKIDGDEKILFVYLDDVESHEDFSKHDELMSKLYNSIASKREHVIAIYTARHPSFVYSKPLVRKVREAQAADKPVAAADAPADAGVQKEVKAEAQPEARQTTVVKDQVVLVNPHFLFALNKLQVKEEDLDINSVTLSINETSSEVTANLKQGSHDIAFNIVLSAGTWYVKTFSYNGARYHSNVPISAYNGKSFGCGDIRLTDTKDQILIGNVQIQPLFQELGGTATLEKFADTPNDCVGFFSAAIWGALFVVILLLSIMSWGLMMILDIRTMDRFDDPKGKTITINAQE